MLTESDLRRVAGLPPARRCRFERAAFWRELTRLAMPRRRGQQALLLAMLALGVPRAVRQAASVTAGLAWLRRGCCALCREKAALIGISLEVNPRARKALARAMCRELQKALRRGDDGCEGK